MAFDSLDGSSIVETNFTVGTVFGVWPGDTLLGRTGYEQAAAAVGVYGPRTVYCLTIHVSPPHMCPSMPSTPTSPVVVVAVWECRRLQIAERQVAPRRGR